MKILITTLLLPIGLVLMLVAAALWVACQARVRRGLLIGLLSTTFIGGYLLSTPVVGSALNLALARLAQNVPGADPTSAQIIIVLTSGMYWAGPSVGWMPKPESIHRLAVGYEIQRMLGLRIPVIVSGGHTFGFNNPSEARTTADFFARHRSELVPTELEESSTNTYESALQLAPILARREAHNIILVTGEAHLARSMATYRARGINVLGIPATGLWQPSGVQGWLPSMEGLTLSTNAVYEGLGMASYLLSGKIKLSDLTIENKG
jgi:uncharacterized SAM-binding protein YcdF (DUF218 family)